MNERGIAMPKKKLTSAQKAANKKRRKEWMMIFVRGKQKRIRRPATINGIDVEQFIADNADDIWLLQEGRYEQIDARGTYSTQSLGDDAKLGRNFDDEIPF